MKKIVFALALALMLAGTFYGGTASAEGCCSSAACCASGGGCCPQE